MSSTRSRRTSSIRPFISFFYGVHPDKCHGYLAAIDLLLPPRKCPFNCPYCPLPASPPVKKSLEVKVDLNHFESAIEKHADVLASIRNVILWGYGDPLLVANLPEVIKVIRRFSGDGILIVHSSGAVIPKAVKTGVLNYIDELRVQLPWPGVEDFMGYAYTHLDGFANMLHVVSGMRNIVAELVVARKGSEVYPDPLLLSRLSSMLSKNSISRIQVETLTRPPLDERYKPVSKRVLSDIAEYFSSNGFHVEVCDRQLQPLEGVRVHGLLNVIYNHVLRHPLSTGEVRAIYGDNGLIALDNLIARGLVEKKAWEGMVFYRALL